MSGVSYWVLVAIGALIVTFAILLAIRARRRRIATGESQNVLLLTALAGGGTALVVMGVMRLTVFA